MVFFLEFSIPVHVACADNQIAYLVDPPTVLPQEFPERTAYVIAEKVSLTFIKQTQFPGAIVI